MVLVVFWIIRKELVHMFWEEIIQVAAVPSFQCLDGNASAGMGGGMELGKAGVQVWLSRLEGSAVRKAEEE